MAIETIHIAGISEPVSRIGLGTWAIGGSMWGGSNDEQSIATLHEALERGINLIDTAPVYGFGHSEEVVGKALAGRRDKAIIATKVALDWDDAGRVTRNSTPQRIRQEIEDSLRRLQTDYIDLYQVHWPDDLVAIDETARVLETLHQQGNSALSASVTIRQRRWTDSAAPRRWQRCSRRSTCLNEARPKQICCPMRNIIRWWCWPTARFAVGCCPAA
ncbi:General stress protein 69 [Cedecea neteri]|uniref:General stress protein 69 n=1 Tax=Cedecea neteri TaxID=158822 RepID=A0A2X3KXY6_9ENTR|nr:General stress protein 69 [Cedecea neteri]